MAAVEALAEARRAAHRGEVRFTAHARERMLERHAQAADVIQALKSATFAVREGATKWKLTGSDLDGDEFIVVAALEEGQARVVTIY